MAKLKQTIGQKTLLMLILNSILGTGIFFLPAVGAGYSGTGSLFSWLVMSVIAVIISLYFAEIASVQQTGGTYGFVKNVFGKGTGFLFGWLSWIVSSITIAMLIVGSLIYVLPDASALVKITAALFFVVLFNVINYRGIDFASKMLLFFGIMTVLTLLALIIPGLAAADVSSFSGIFSTPIPLMLLTVYFIAETFFGWETATYLSEEIKNSRHVLPKMLVLSTVIIAILSVMLVIASLGNIDAGEFAAQKAPLAFLADHVFGSGFGSVFAIIIFIPLIGTAASWIVSSPRLLYAMSRDKVLVPRFARVHNKYRTPHAAIIFQTLTIGFLTILAFGNFLFLLSLLVPLVVVMYSLAMLSVVKLRMDKPKLKRYFNAPLPKAGPIFVVLFNLMLLYFWLTEVSGAVYIFAMGIFLIILGLPLYVLIRLSVDKKFTENFYDRIAFFWDRFFHIWYGEKEASRIVNFLKLKENSKALDFGCGSGNTTLFISRKLKKGTVIAVDLSEKQLEHAAKKLRKQNLHNVIFVKGSFKPPKNCFDAVTAVGVLEHLDRPARYVNQLVSSLKKGGRFYFLSFGESLGIPGPEFLKDDKNIRDMFKGTRVELRIERKKKRLAEYVSMYGVKK